MKNNCSKTIAYSKAYFKYIDASCDIMRGVDLHTCHAKLQSSLADFASSRQLSSDGVLTYIKAFLLSVDIKYSIELLNAAAATGNGSLSDLLARTSDELMDVQRLCFDILRINGGETVEHCTDKHKTYFDNIVGDIKNIYHPVLHLLVHVKLRLGSTLMLRASCLKSSSSSLSSSEDETHMSNARVDAAWQHALSVLATGIEINRVIVERNVMLEIELNFKHARCLRELFTSQNHPHAPSPSPTSSLVTLSDVIDAYAHTIELLHYSSHDLKLIRSCYLELAITFIFVYDAEILNFSTK